MKTDTRHNIYEFQDCSSIVICGDIHGDFNLLVNKICVQYQMRDTLIIVAGDCGFGFEAKGYYDNIVKRNAKRMNECNNWIVFVRGNHDNPAYFDGKAFMHKRFMAVADYSIIKACSHAILCVGGAISIDRQYRKQSWEKYVLKQKGHIEIGPFARNCYWSNEIPVFDSLALDRINETCAIDTVITHTAPSFCELQSKNGLCCFAYEDSTLIDDVNSERSIMDLLHEKLIQQNHPITHWCYGHFHQSWHNDIDGVLFKMLDIMELYELH